MNSKERKSNIELLRIISILGVIVLHYNNTEMGQGFLYSVGANKVILYILESVFICAVNVFMLISAYFLCNKEERKYEKPIELIIQVSLFGVAFQVLSMAMNQRAWSVTSIFSGLIPNNYFVILYIVCYFISPYINILLKNLGQDKSKKFIILLFCTFSCWPTAVDLFQEITRREWTGLSSIGMLGSQNGYTIVNFLLIYAIGAYLGIYGNEQRKHVPINNNKMRIGITILLAIVITIWALALNQIEIIGGSAWAYCNPLVIIESILIFQIFNEIQMGSNKVINQLAKAAFTVYLLHTPFLHFIGIELAVKSNPVIMLLHVTIASIGIYFICFICYYIYETVTRPIYRRIFPTQR